MRKHEIVVALALRLLEQPVQRARHLVLPQDATRLALALRRAELAQHVVLADPDSRGHPVDVRHRKTSNSPCRRSVIAAVPMPRVPGITTGGGTAFAGDAIELVCEHLEMTNPRRPRFLYVLSDGGWADTQAGVQKIRWLAEHAVPTIHLSIGIAPRSVECDRIPVITDPLTRSTTSPRHRQRTTRSTASALSGGRRERSCGAAPGRGETAPQRRGDRARVGIVMDLDALDPLDPLEPAPARGDEPARCARGGG